MQVTSEDKHATGRGRRRKIDEWRGVGSFGTIGLEIVLCIAFGFFGGRWLDEKFGTAPYLSVVGFVFGLAAAIKGVMRAHAEMQREAAREEREQGNPRPLYDARDDKRKDAEIEKERVREPESGENDEGDADDEKADR